MKFELICKIYKLAKPYGRKKLAFVFAVMLSQGLFLVIGVTSIFPFLALASDPASLRDSSLGSHILDWLPAMSDRSMLIAAGLFAVVMLIVSNGLLLLGEIVRIRYVEGLGHWLRIRLLSRMASNPYHYFLHRNTGELLKKAVQDVRQMIAGVLLPILDVLSRTLTVLMLVVGLLFVDPWVTLIAALVFGGFYLLSFRFLKGGRASISARLKLANRGAMREAQQLLGGIKVVKVHQAERAFIERYREHSFIQATQNKWIPIFTNTPRYLIEPLAFGGMVIAVLIFAVQGESLVALLPKLGVMAFAAYRILPNLQALYNSVSQVSMTRHALEEVYEEFEDILTGRLDIAMQKNRCPEPLRWQNEISIEDLTFRYQGTEKPLFCDLSFRVPKNQFVALVGETGSGKSTLVDLLLGLHTPSDGLIRVDETTIDAHSLPAWRASLGYVPQEIFLVDDTIAANIAFGIPSHKIEQDRLATVARTAQIADFIENELPQSYETQVGERGVRLSGGQRQRIGLARALYHQPTTLILDEATSALDNETEADLMRAIESLQGEMTLIVIAHRLSTIEKADRIYELGDGKILREGTFTELYAGNRDHVQVATRP